jgi:hypothetical protein
MTFDFNKKSLFDSICLHIANGIIESQLLIRLYLGRCNITIVDNRSTVVILQKLYSRGLLVLIVDYRAAGMQLQLRDSNTSLLSAPYLNHKRTALVFANKDMAFGI